MANREEYRFDVSANTEQASKAIDDLINKFGKLERTINGIHQKGFENNYTTNQKDMDKSMRSYSQMAKEIRQANKYIQGSINKSFRDMEKIKPPKAPRMPNKPKEPAPIRKNARKEVRDDYEKRYASYQRREANYQKRMQNYSSQSKQYEKEKAAYDHRATAHEQFVNRMIQSERKLQRMMNNAGNKHQDLTGFSQNYSKNFDHKLNGNGIYNMPPDPMEATKRMRAIFGGQDALESSNNKVRDSIKSVQRLRRRNDSLSRRGAAQGALSYQQAKNFHDDYNTAQTKYNTDREANFRYAGKLGIQRSQLQGKISEIEQNPEKYGDEGYHQKLGHQRNIEAIDEEIQNRHRLNAEIEQTMTSMQEYRDRLLANNVSVDAKRGSFARNMSERSAAIGLAMGATIAGSFVNLYSQGSSIDKAMRDQSIYAGQSTGMNGKQWGQFESNTINAGLTNRLGFTGQEMMSFQNDYLQNAGFHGFKDLSAATNNQAMFSRATGIDANTTGSFFGTMTQTGGMTGSQMKNFQDAFIGGIKNSGLMGRQTQQLQALQSLVQNVTQGHNVDNSQLNSIAALQGVFASSGNHSMQGQAGSDMLSQMNNGIQQGFYNPQMRLIFGAGTKFQGLAGMWQLQKQMNAGIMGPEGVKNLQTMYNYAKKNGGSNPDAQNEVAAQFAHQAGMNLTTDQIEGFMNLGRQGKIDDKSIADYQKKAEAAGKKQSAKNTKNYQDSSAATNNQSDAVFQKQAKALYDNTEILRKVNASLGNLNPLLYGGVLAIGALTGMLATTFGSFGFSTAIKSAFTGKFGSSIGNLAEYTGIKKLGNKLFGGKFRAPEDMPSPNGPTAPGEAPPGFTDANGLARADALKSEEARAKAAGEPGPDVNRLPHMPSDINPNINPKTGSSGGGNWFTKGIKSFGSGGKAFNFFNGALKWAGRIATPLAIGSGIFDVATAKKGTKIQTAGKDAGGIWGGLAGAARGGTMGAEMGGPWGALAGALIGGVAGSGLGKLVGGGVGWLGQKAWNGVTGLFSPSHAKAAELSPSELKKQNAMRKTQDKHNTDTQARTEDKKTYNVHNEATNLSTQDKQLNRMQQLLAQARQQNGIIGTLTGLGGGGTGGTVGGGASTTNAKGNQASIWNYFAKQGYSASAISGILGNIGTETGGTFDPTTKQKGGPGMGLAQWTQGQRWTQLTNWAKQNGLNPNDMNTQLQFMQKEMNGMGLTPDKMNGMSVGQATSTFEQKFEGAGKPNMTSRNNYANQAYNQFANSPQATNNATSGASNTHTINSNINVNLTGNSDAVNQIASNSQLQSVGQKLQQMIYGSMGYYSQETSRA